MRSFAGGEDSVAVTVFLGAPGSGKGTQAKRLAQTQGFQHFSTGDMLRAAIKAGSPTGMKAKEFIDRGELVPDDVMIKLITIALSDKPRGAAGVILDGFPRTVAQARALDTNPETSVQTAVHFMVPEEALIARLTGRRVCESCGEPYHVRHIPPKREGVCDKCGGRVVQRADDTEGVVRRRLEVFAAQNERLLEYYGPRKKLRELDGDRPVEELQRALLKVLSLNGSN